MDAQEDDARRRCQAVVKNYESLIGHLTRVAKLEEEAKVALSTAEAEFREARKAAAGSAIRSHRARDTCSLFHVRRALRKEVGLPGAVATGGVRAVGGGGGGPAVADVAAASVAGGVGEAGEERAAAEEKEEGGGAPSWVGGGGEGAAPDGSSSATAAVARGAGKTRRASAIDGAGGSAEVRVIAKGGVFDVVVVGGIVFGLLMPLAPMCSK